MAKSTKTAASRRAKAAGAKHRDKLSGEIGERIARARSAANLTTIASLHKRTVEVDPEKKGVSQPVLLAYEAGDYRPGARELKLLCLAMGVSPTWMLFGQENTLKEPPSAGPVALSFNDLVTLTDEQKRGALLGLLFGYMTKQERESWINVIELFLRAKLGNKQFEMRQFALQAMVEMLSGEQGIFQEIEKVMTQHLGPEQIEKIGETFKAKAAELGLSLEDAAKQVSD